MPERPPWLAEFAQAPATLLFDDVVRVYFSCRPPADARRAVRELRAYVDLDRGDLTRVLRVSDEPILTLGGTGEFDEFGTYPVSVDPRRQTRSRLLRGLDALRVRAVQRGHRHARRAPTRRDVREGSGVARSSAYSPDEPFVMSGPKVRRFGDTWHLFYIAGRRWKVVDGRPEPVYKIRMATSPDGIAWTKHGEDLIESRVEADEAQASPDVVCCAAASTTCSSATGTAATTAAGSTATGSATPRAPT